ncbi:WAP four-disulfide core domain protein 2-like isoform X2 [Rana temporaria]|uniref:WAP four-disulfide core domain protein 2-like isoform X2 n=1 Tax=Rana temporaria TaxID=8407 RepID=UPI001AAE0FB2|nr:WAP four-disulfide core domain protein 2-like isoform X2 [Rana temporaria]
MRPLCYLLIFCVIATLHLEASGFFLGKPGCPIPSARNCPGVQDRCQTDRQCGQNGKCCSNGCSKLCSFGACPKPTTLSCQGVQDQCQTDKQCGQNGKCCSNGCSKLCAIGGVFSKLANFANPISWAMYGPFQKK